MHECNCCARTFRTRRSCDQHMDDKGHWSFECNVCTKEVYSQHAVEQHMTAVGHWTRRPQAARISTITSLLWTSAGVEQHDMNKHDYEDKVALDTCEASKTKKTGSHQHKLMNGIARYIPSYPDDFN
ncbi:hypothetical protein GQ44DRAFT_631155 [Phaeosphaeriaceae sp. PMI808]|nr:hypothetical protein GQ44DRAFT_631155 [Phaeosphaeriaceae sp. PMI808]